MVERSEKPVCVYVVYMMRVPFRFTPGVAAQLEKKRTGPSQADVEAIKVLVELKNAHDCIWREVVTGVRFECPRSVSDSPLTRGSTSAQLML